MQRFKGKVAIVAGGARGLGGSAAEELAREGARVVVADTNRELGTDLAESIGRGRATFVEVDVRSPDACANAIAAAERSFGPPDLLVNSAISINGAALLELDLEAWNTTLNVGLTGTFLMAQAFARSAAGSQRRGAIVNLSSVAAFNPYGGAGAYSTVKAAIVHLTQLMALEWAPHRIRVNAVAPGTVETPLTAYLKDPDVRRGRTATIPLGRIGQPLDVAKSILFLLSDDADWITGSTLAVDGGFNNSLMNHIPGRNWSK
ncbi:SDR family oxidoreductase [Bradyrhizobium sp. 187]|uniref:SDR family NAD(P)-dependent oxidoreductase n=1 Tax=Bradyrhizobium sp. 187 TaxID=2782655 RepID=UPI001FFFDB17|nr:SDR family oxidoreductase [Bradyrhizobium sp. 187]UPJ71853.1 SDR family oxidoreductase [Bradyrhizobium sp. 187]